MDARRARPDRTLLPVQERINKASQPKQAALACLTKPKAKPSRRLNACRHLMIMGALAEATEALHPLTRIFETSDAAKALLRTCRMLQDQAPLVSDPIEKDEQGCFWHARAPGASATVVAFAGRAQRIGVSAYFMQRILSQLGCNLILLFDPAERFYLGGVAGLGNSVQETASLLRPVITALGAKPVICLGQSSGAFGAIRYARALHATGVLAFSPTLPLRPTRARLLKELGNCTPADFDLLGNWRSDPAPPQLRIVCGGAHAGDLALARTFQGAPTVELMPLLDVSEHCSLQYMVMNGSFFGMAKTFIAETTSPCSVQG